MGKYIVAAVEVVAGVVLTLTGNPILGGQLIATGILSAGAAALSPTPHLPSTGNQTTWKADPWAGVPYAMGRTGTAGNIIFRNTHGDKNSYQNVVTVYSCAGPVESFDKIFIDQVEMAESGPSAYTVGGAGQHILERHQLGETPETGVMSLPPHSNDTGDDPSWTAEHKLSGYAAAQFRFDWDTQGDNTMMQVPQTLREGHWVKVYDPRKDSTYPGGSGSHRWVDPLTDKAGHDAAKATWEWSENPYLHALHWLLGRWERDRSDLSSTYKRIIGVGIPIERILLEQFVEGANVCDANGWTMGGVVYSTDDKWDIFKKILQAGGGEPVKHGTKIGCIVNMPRVSLASITEADIIGEIGVQATQARRDRINACFPRGRFESLFWEVDAATPVVVDSYVAFDGRQRNLEVTYDMVQVAAGQDPTQLVQLARYEIENAREFGPITMPLKLRWYGYKPGDCVTVTNSEVGLTNQLVMIRNRTLDPATGVVTLSGRTETTAKHAFALGQTGTAPATPTVHPPPTAPIPASNAFTLTAIIQSAGGTKTPALQIAVNVADPSISSVDGIIFEYRVYSGGNGANDNWLAAGIEPPTLVTQNLKKIITGVLDGTQYEVSIRYRMGKLISQTRRILGPVTTGQTLVPSATMSVPSTITLEANYQGTITPSDQLPYYFSPVVLKAGADITKDDTVQYTLAKSNGITATIDNTNGSTTKGRVAITALSGTSENLTITATVDGGTTVLEGYVTVRRHDSLVPVTTGSKSQSTPLMIVPFTSSYAALIANFDSIVVGSGESLYGTATISAYQLIDLFSQGQTFTAKYQYRTHAGPGSWNDFAAGVVSTAQALNPRTYIVTPAQLTLVQSASPGAGTYDVRVVVLETDPNASFHAMYIANGNVSIEAKV